MKPALRDISPNDSLLGIDVPSRAIELYNYYDRVVSAIQFASRLMKTTSIGERNDFVQALPDTTKKEGKKKREISHRERGARLWYCTVEFMVAVLNSESIIRSFPITISVVVLTTARRMKFMAYMSKHGEGVGLTLPRAHDELVQL